VSLIKDYGFDGIDLDWEYPTYTNHSGTPADKANFVLLLKELRSKLDAYGKQTGKYYEITAAVSCGPAQIQESYDILGIAQYLTQINLMSYDFHGDWESVTGPLAPLYYPGFGDEGLTVDACVKTWLKGCSGCKYNIGLPFYGRSFAYATGFNQDFSGKDEANWPRVDGADPGTPEYWAIEKKFRQMVLKRDEKSHTEMGSFSDGSGLISFDDGEAICDKVEYGQTHNLNGYIIWDIQGDLRDDLSQPLLDVVNKKLNNPSYDCSNAPVPPPESAKEVIGYYAEWGRYPRDKLAVPSNMDFHKVTIVNYAFFQTDANGYIYSYDPWGAANNLFGPQVWDGSGV